MIEVHRVGRFGLEHFDPLRIAELLSFGRLGRNYLLHNWLTSRHRRRKDIRDRRWNRDLGWRLDCLPGVDGISYQPMICGSGWVFRETKPEVLRFSGGTDADLRLQWQEFLIRIIADAFDLPPMLLGLERDVNRNTATTQYDDAFRTAVVPVARLIAEHLTRDAISKRLGWDDLEFVFTDVDAPNELEQAQIQQILIGCGVFTVNEVRRLRGLPPLRRPGNAMKTSSQLSVVRESIADLCSAGSGLTIGVLRLLVRSPWRPDSFFRMTRTSC